MRMKITEQTWALAKPEAEKLGLTLWDVKYVKEGASYYLRLFIDKDGGVSIDDCVALTEAMNPILDAEDYITDSYYFEVSSPGLGRELSLPWHFDRYLGKDVHVKLFKGWKGRKEFTGKLVSRSETETVLALDGGNVPFENAAISRVKAADDQF